LKKKRRSRISRRPKKRVLKRKRSKPKARKVSRKTVRKKRPKKLPRKQQKKSPREGKLALLGEITHYFPKVQAAVFVCRGPLSVGEPILVKGKTTHFRQTVSSMQIDRKSIDRARRGQEIGLEVLKEVRVGDSIYRERSL